MEAGSNEAHDQVLVVEASRLRERAERQDALRKRQIGDARNERAGFARL